MPVRSTTLDNGMTVITHSMPSLESASVGVWVKAGSRCENEDEHGISHLLEHMAFKGTATRSARDIAEEIETVGGDVNAATSVENTGYFSRVLKEDVGMAADILSDILQNSQFSEEELQREKHVIVQEIGASHDAPDDYVYDLFQGAAYQNQPIGQSILGTVESVESFTPDAIRSYMDRTYVGDQMVMAAAGNVNHDELVDIATKKFDGLKATGAPAPVEAKFDGGDIRLQREHEQAHVLIGVEGRAYHSDGFYASQILASILGGGMSSRLFQEVREKRGLCYSIYSFHWAFADSGIFGVSAATGNEDLGELVPVVLDELKQATLDISEKEVVRVRNQIRAGLLMSLERPSSRAGQLARQQLLWGRPIPLEETIERINNIDATRVMEVAGQLFNGAKPVVAGIGPMANLPEYDKIEEQLKF
ncbi:M16 family metallopeptidase [Maritalea sp.]|uniref:M16 family metallopeptidase n=1 Tax=Maritalea sp. TaxID=2003361 RepID=UPI003EF09A84